MIIKKYEIINNKANKDIKIALFSDIHLSKTFKLKRFKQILNNLKENKPNYICITGDIVDKTNILDSKEYQNLLLDFLKKLGKISPTYITLGNHDCLKKENKKYKKENNAFWTKELQKLKKYNVFLLMNEIKTLENINFISYITPYEYYYKNKKKDSKEILIKDLSNKKELFNQDNKKLNILLFHDPYYITNKEVIDKLKNIDIILSGHMHNGLIPNIIDKIFPKNRGLIAPNRKLYPDNARGIKIIKHKTNLITLIISGGITKISETSPKILHFIDYLYRPQIEYLTITKN